VIDQDKVVAHIDAPQDKQIADLSLKLNETYLGYGAHRDQAAEMQMKADKDALANNEKGAHVQRALTKSSQNYSNSSWDLCDAVKDKKIDITKLKQEELPENLRGKSVEELNKLVADATAKREQIQKEIQTLSKEREAHIAEALKKQADSGDKSLDQAMIEATRNQASKVGYNFKK
jgi:Tfp pilus assembly protein PilV